MNELKDLKMIQNSGQPLSVIEGFDYRWMDYTYKVHPNHPMDNSVMTFRGHTVLQTLIRCHFSPLETTGQRYLYSGSGDGSVYIFDILTGSNKA
jgi:DDB1- and CUL4-associated factor 11